MFFGVKNLQKMRLVEVGVGSGGARMSVRVWSLSWTWYGTMGNDDLAADDRGASVQFPALIGCRDKRIEFGAAVNRHPEGVGRTKVLEAVWPERMARPRRWISSTAEFPNMATLR